MIDQNKTIIMTKMAVYEKNYEKTDRIVEEYFLHDYISRKNIWTRFCVFFGGIILLGFYWLHRFVFEELDIFVLDIRQAITQAVVFIVVLLVLYSLLGSVVWSLEYKRSEKRRRYFYNLMGALSKQQSGPMETKEASDLYYGANVGNTREDH